LRGEADAKALFFFAAGEVAAGGYDSKNESSLRPRGRGNVYQESGLSIFGNAINQDVRSSSLRGEERSIA